ncbi:MAG TPA: Asp-tRNA(Asn)/Glu-tRNA(Gln) amidotransferase subunit GatC [Bryobacteraceae bacterium]|nr:Asp-tRNA(Asn)/Glu-tRNA(Gln) amidotransferase subunit GatC [Bryobacteraceae bacterium]
MKITEDQVRYVADLANLSLTEHEVRKFQADLDEILAHVDRLNDIDTSQVEPMAQVLYEAEETATLRLDRERPGLGNELALDNAPLAGAGFFKVPEVIKR